MSLSVTRDILTEIDNMSTFFVKIKGFFLEHETKIMLFVGFCLISAISYEFGVLQGQKWQQKPLVIEKPIETPKEGVIAKDEANFVPANVSIGEIPAKTQITAMPSNCAYVGSKNSNKFYLPSCSYAKRIKPENVVCFKSSDQALGQGRTESKCAPAAR